MSGPVDTSTPSVEATCAALCEYNAHLRLREKPDTNGNIPPLEYSWLHIAEEQLRALAAERDALRAVVARLDQFWSEDCPGGPDDAFDHWTDETVDLWRAARAALKGTTP